MTNKQFLLVVGLVMAAFAAGWLANGGRPVYAQSDVPQIDLRPVGPNVAMVIFYPSQKRAYVYSNPFIGAPKQGCAYSFLLKEPGGLISREQCKIPDSFE